MFAQTQIGGAQLQTGVAHEVTKELEVIGDGFALEFGGDQFLREQLHDEFHEFFRVHGLAEQGLAADEQFSGDRIGDGLGGSWIGFHNACEGSEVFYGCIPRGGDHLLKVSGFELGEFLVGGSRVPDSKFKEFKVEGEFARSRRRKNGSRQGRKGGKVKTAK